MGTAPKQAFAERKIPLANILVATDFSPISHALSNTPFLRRSVTIRISFLRT